MNVTLFRNSLCRYNQLKFILDSADAIFNDWGFIRERRERYRLIGKKALQRQSQRQEPCVYKPRNATDWWQPPAAKREDAFFQGFQKGLT